MSATPTFQREGRIEPPPMPYGDLELQPPPPLYAGEGAGSNVIMTAVPMLGSLGSVAFVATSGNGSIQSYLAAGMFLLASVGFVGVSIWRARSGKTAQVTSNRREYLNYLRGIRELARKAGAEQRKHLSWIHPDPTALASVAEDRTRVWERSPSEDDWLLVRYARGPQRLGLELKPPESDTIDKLDPVSASALHRLLATHRILSDLPTAVALNCFARIEVTGTEEHARAQTRAIVMQAALFHAPDQLVIAVLTKPESLMEWDWVKWLPHAQSRREADAAGPRRLICTDLDELVSLLPGDLSERPRFGPSSNPTSPHVLVVLDNVFVPVRSLRHHAGRGARHDGSRHPRPLGGAHRRVPGVAAPRGRARLEAGARRRGRAAAGADPRLCRPDEHPRRRGGGPAARPHVCRGRSGP